MYDKSNLFLIDIDGVACEHAKAICDWVNNQYKINAKVKDVTTWDHNFGPITFCEAVKRCYPDRNFILNMEVASGFCEFLERLAKMMTVKFASTRKSSRDASQLWVEKNFGRFEVLFVNSKTEVDFDYLVDDYPEEAIAAVEKGKTCFLISRPWNNNKDTKSKLRKFKRLHFVESFADIINCLNSEVSEK